MSFFNKKKSVRGSNGSGGFSPRNAAMLILVVAAFSLVIAPAVSSSMARPAAAASAEPTFRTQQAPIATDAVGNLSGNEGAADSGNNTGGGGNENGNAQCPPGFQCLIRGDVGATKQFALDISATGKVSGSNALATAKIEAIVDIDTKKGSILRVQENSVSGSAEIKDRNGNTAATLDLSNITFDVKGAKLTVNADFTDQDDDKGKFTASLFAKDKIDANSSTVTLNSKSNSLSINYNTVNQRFTATGNSVEAELSLT
ncbi:hypothetical protein NTE_00458 [Candidatus Nitrososphaera evergladensis SR1]|uniref:Uncharacterized protein n=1 Tax=Candidatus Nitrososphaera evergladensis SR1 TaxID=1459636 RepID=A0A075MN16_9ARCH|nr:hypothetical protein [Candidatus Nitrososphaera evergladensis]AIF82540.1 hypothetical protein NTE_00458 [Candidatus Nitrososphaera evergladensis SR1]